MYGGVNWACDMIDWPFGYAEWENVVVDGSTASKWEGCLMGGLCQHNFIQKQQMESRIHKRRMCQRWEATMGQGLEGTSGNATQVQHHDARKVTETN